MAAMNTGKKLFQDSILNHVNVIFKEVNSLGLKTGCDVTLIQQIFQKGKYIFHQLFTMSDHDVNFITQNYIAF